MSYFTDRDSSSVDYMPLAKSLLEVEQSVKPEEYIRGTSSSPLF